MEYKGYVARVEFDESAGVLFGEVEGLRDVVTFEATDVDGLTKAFQESVDDYLELCAERGEEPEKPYSGKFLLRLDPRLHREVALAAAREGKSLNAFASEVFSRRVESSRPTQPVSVAASRKAVPGPNAEVRESGPRLYPSAAGAGAIASGAQASPDFWAGALQDKSTGANTSTTPASHTPGSSVPTNRNAPESKERNTHKKVA
jgi:predicted HicB family RNase H-like nuclease